jgi:hypothetical protein
VLATLFIRLDGIHDISVDQAANIKAKLRAYEAADGESYFRSIF